MLLAPISKTVCLISKNRNGQRSIFNAQSGTIQVLTSMKARSGNRTFSPELSWDFAAFTALFPVYGTYNLLNLFKYQMTFNQ